LLSLALWCPGLEAKAVASKGAFRADDGFESDLSKLLGETNMLKYKRELEYQHAMDCVACLVST
jgi:hypothetical protein